MSTGIEWTDETWNTIVGCSRISEGCKNCYAATAANSARLQQFWQYQEVKDWNGQVVFVENQLMKPFEWKKPKRIFVCSMSDLFHENIPDEWRDGVAAALRHRIFSVIALNPRHTFQILTKRPNQMRDYLQGAKQRIRRASVDMGRKFNLPYELWESYETCQFDWPLKNVWVGVTAENQKAASERIPVLLRTPAALRFISFEPLLEPISLQLVPMASTTLPQRWEDAQQEVVKVIEEVEALPFLDWAIIGGESGKNARACHIEWIRHLVKQCQVLEIPVFVKQLGTNVIDGTQGLAGSHRIPFRNRKAADISEWSEDLVIQEFPSNG